MPRDIAGNYTLPAGNPVVPNTIIATNWANTTMQDIADALSASLSIDGSVTTAKIADDAVTPPKLAGLDVNGLVARISATEFEGRTITGTANKVTVTNGDGVAANPTLTLPDAITLVTPTITGVANFGSAPEPTTDSATDFGTSSKRWQHAYVEGINFPASQVASADANTLDDYEEGTWTPAITFDTPGTLSVSYSVQAGRYTKIGRQVTIQFAAVTSSFTLGTATGSMRISGVPFVPGSVNGHGSMYLTGFTSYPAGATFSHWAVEAGSSTLLAFCFGPGAVSGPMSHPQYTTGTAPNHQGTITYSV